MNRRTFATMCVSMFAILFGERQRKAPEKKVLVVGIEELKPQGIRIRWLTHHSVTSLSEMGTTLRDVWDVHDYDLRILLSSWEESWVAWVRTRNGIVLAISVVNRDIAGEYRGFYHVPIPEMEEKHAIANTT